MKTVVFDALFELTPVLYKIAENLSLDEVKVIWIVGDEESLQFLLGNNVRSDDICDVRNASQIELTEEQIKDMHEVEKKSSLSLYGAIQMDRFLMQEGCYSGELQLIKIFAFMREFICSRKAESIFAEATNIREMLLFLVAEILDINYFTPNDMRYPERRVVFTRGYLKNDVVGGVLSDDSKELAKDLIRRAETKSVRPHYYQKQLKPSSSLLKQLLGGGIRRFSRMIKNRNGNRSLTTYNFVKKFKFLVLFRLRRIYLTKLQRHQDFHSLIENNNKKVAFYPLHVQPEASIDVLGIYVNDQYKLIADIRKSLTSEWLLIVKEHPNSLGSKPLELYKKIVKLPGVKLVDAQTSSYELIDKSELVLTVSGTPAFEAGILNKKALTFSPMYFNKLPTVMHCENILNLSDYIKKLDDIKNSNDFGEIEMTISAMINKSYSGLWTDAGFNPSVLEKDNIDKLSFAFNDIIKRY